MNPTLTAFAFVGVFLSGIIVGMFVMGVAYEIAKRHTGEG